MKVIMAFLLLSLLLCGCGRHQAAAQSPIVGTWKSNESNGEITYDADGSFSSNWHYNISHSNTYIGTWQIAGNTIILTLTNAVGTEPHERVGNVDHYRISRLDGGELIVVDLTRTNVPLAFTREK
jgi:hypothetical protein